VLGLLALGLSAPAAHAADEWSQVGENLDGDDPNNGDFGYEVDISADGSVLATSVPDSDKVFIYRWNGSDWNLSETITGGQADAGFGLSLALSADGTTLVVGSPLWIDNGRPEGRVQIFDYDGTSWSQTLDSESGVAGRYGDSVDISADGSTVVAGNPNYPGLGGKMVVFSKTGSTWTSPDGTPFMPDDYKLGTHVSVSDDGSVIVASALVPNPEFAAKAYVYTFDGAALSTPTVIDVGTHTQYDWPSVALSGDGTLLAAGATNYDTGSGNDDTGAVFLYEFDGSSWNSQAVIPGTAEGVEEGYAVALSSDGRTLATTASGSSDGSTRVFTYDGSNWNQRGDTFTGSDDQNLGDGLALANDGYTVAIGSPDWYNQSVVNWTGRLQVFSWPRPASGDAIPGPATYFTFLLPDGRECTSISPQRVQVGTFVELPGVDALCQTMEGSTVAGWAIPNQPGFTGYGSTVQPLPPGLKVRVVESQRFTLVPFEPVLQITYDANIADDDACTPANLAHSSENGRIGYSWVPRADFAAARTWSQAPCVPQGHRLVGWNTAGDGSGQSIELGAPLPADWEAHRTNSHRLYAMWTAS